MKQQMPRYYGKNIARNAQKKALKRIRERKQKAICAEKKSEAEQ